MTNNTSSSSSVNIGFGGLLLVALVVLKLNPGGHLDSPVEDWSWWLVIFTPLLIGVALTLALVLAVGAVACIGFLIALVVDFFKGRKREKERQARINKRVGPDRFSK